MKDTVSRTDVNPIYPRVLPVGETAFTVEFGDRVDVTLNRRVHVLDAALAHAQLNGVIECVPCYRSLLVIYDPTTIAPAELRAVLLALARADVPPADEGADRLMEIPVHYGGDDGPDLATVAEHCGLAQADVISLHSGATYQVAMLGFAPGFAYLLGLHRRLTTPRLQTPRLRVVPGSVGIADDQTGVYALGTPGGWRIIGRTHLVLFDADRDDPFALRAGDRVRFVVA